MLKNNKGETLQQHFLCHKAGTRQDRGLSMEERMRESKLETRCGCEAKVKMHVHSVTGHWYVTHFTDQHNHQVLGEQFCGMLPTHKTMSEVDVVQMNNFRKVGIGGASHIFGSFANQTGGYEKVGFSRKDIYNQISRQHKRHCSDAQAALRYLQQLGSKDPMMFVRYTIDREGRLEHLFWCDGVSQLNYKVYGDVLAFDPTYGKNKYLLPLVVFSGVNKHNLSIIFAAVVVGNETDETYVWLLQQFLTAMKDRKPNAVITDGDNAMRNAIRRVFPDAHHRLCVWHRLHNVTSNIGKPEFTADFQKCMLTEYDVGKFRSKWLEMVSKFGIEDNPWIISMYKKRSMWATAHIRGKFFTGFRTTSRCEGLHSELGKFVHSRYNLREFLEQYNRCLNHMRFKELEDDFGSIHGEPVLQTRLPLIERSTAHVGQ